MQFQKALGVYDATMIVAGSMIGSGVFIVSADIARTVDSPALLLLVWGITGLLTLIAALSYGELAGMMPQAGGQYVYLREAFGPMAGFLYGWTLFSVIQTGTIAAVAMAFAKFTAVLIPWFSEKHVLFTIPFGEGGLNISGAQVLAIISIVGLTALNARGVRAGRIVQNLFTSTKVIAVVALAIIGIIYGLGTDAFVQNFSRSFSGEGAAQPLNIIIPMIAVAMVGSIFSSDAWNNITFVAGEVKDPHRTIPRALMLGVTMVTVLYLAANVAYLSVLPLEAIKTAANDRVGTAAAEMIFGPAGATIMAVLIMISTFGCNNGIILSGARAYWAMSKDNLFFKGAGTLNKNDVPGNGLWIQALWASALCLSGSYGDLLDYVVFAVLIFYVLTILGIFRLRRTRPLAERPYTAFGYPFVPALYIVVALFICIMLLIYKPNYTWPGLVIVGSGVPVYYLWRRKA